MSIGGLCPRMATQRLRSNSLLATLAIGLAAACLSGPSQARAPGIPSIIERYVRARHSVNLRGVMLTVHPTGDSVRTTSRRVVKRNDGKSLSVFTFPESEKGAFIADDGDWLMRYDPHTRTLRRKRSFVKADMAQVARTVRLILRNYVVKLEPDEQVAGRSCYSLCLEPTRPRNLTVRLWVDKATGAELRREEQDGVGNTISVSIYTSVAFPEYVPPSSVRPPSHRSARTVDISRSGLHTSVGTLSKLAGFPIRTPLALPWGYEFDRGTVVEIAGRRSGFLRYIDGLAEMTIIETKLSPGMESGMRAARVVPRPYGEAEVDYAIDDLQIVIAGRGDARELIAVAETMAKRRENAWLSAMRRSFNGRHAEVAAMRQRGLSAEAIVALLTIAECAGRPPSDLLASYVAGGCWQAMARRWRVPEAEIRRRLQTVVGAK